MVICIQQLLLKIVVNKQKIRKIKMKTKIILLSSVFSSLLLASETKVETKKVEVEKQCFQDINCICISSECSAKKKQYITDIYLDTYKKKLSKMASESCNLKIDEVSAEITKNLKSKAKVFFNKKQIEINGITTKFNNSVKDNSKLQLTIKDLSNEFKLLEENLIKKEKEVVSIKKDLNIAKNASKMKIKAISDKTKELFNKQQAIVEKLTTKLTQEVKNAKNLTIMISKLNTEIKMLKKTLLESENTIKKSNIETSKIKESKKLSDNKAISIQKDLDKSNKEILTNKEMIKNKNIEIKTLKEQMTKNTSDKINQLNNKVKSITNNLKTSIENLKKDLELKIKLNEDLNKVVKSKDVEISDKDKTIQKLRNKLSTLQENVKKIMATFQNKVTK